MATNKILDKFDPLEVDILVYLAQGKSVEDLDNVHTRVASQRRRMWLKDLTPIEAQHELEYRFRRIVSSLVSLCLTGRINYWSSYQKTFLKLFGGSSTPLQKIATGLKKRLQEYTAEEIFAVGQVATLKAIQRTTSNLVSTIVITFKEELQLLIIDPITTNALDLELCGETTTKEEDTVHFFQFLDTLTEEERIAAENLIEGNKVDFPPSLAAKLAEYMKTQ